MCEQGPIANTDQSQTNLLLILHTFLPMRVKTAETGMRIRDPNSARLNGERLAEVPVDAVPISMAGSKTQPLAKCQLSRAPRMVLSMLVISFVRSENMIDSSVSRRHVTFSQQLQVQEADHLQEIEKTEEEGRKAAGGFGEIGGNCDFTSPWKRPS